MSNEVTQWLAQIKAIKQQLADCISDREAAHESAANWRQLYNTEAQQRRTEARLAQKQIDTLKAQIQQLQGESSRLKPDDPEAASSIEQEVEKLQTVEELRAKLKEVLVERDHLSESLKTEQANHAQTRKSLTTVIGDTIDQLTKERSNQQLSLESKESSPILHSPSENSN
jgi:chromosome segregation ATPase